VSSASIEGGVTMIDFDPPVRFNLRLSTGWRGFCRFFDVGSEGAPIAARWLRLTAWNERAALSFAMRNLLKDRRRFGEFEVDEGRRCRLKSSRWAARSASMLDC
jgi:hypothetical protein